ncbi:hypothetical protein GQ457_06G035930 [Hibiscus cannabinus]
MAIGGKSRGAKRSSSASYASTVTTVVFVTLCVLAVWMLTSNSVSSPKTATRATVTDTNGDVAFSGSNDEQPIKITEDKDRAEFEDNPGQLPEDAVKPDDDKKDSAVKETKHGLQGKESAVEEHEKQKTQISEESVLTQNQETKQIIIPKEVEDSKQRSNEEPNKVNQKVNNNSNKLDSSDDQDQIRPVEKQQVNEKPKERGADKKKKKKTKGDAGSDKKMKKTTMNGKPKDDDPEKLKNDTAEMEDEQKRNKQQQNKEQQEIQMQDMTNATFSDETKNKQKEILNATDALSSLLKTSTSQKTAEKDIQNEAQNQETKQQNESTTEGSLGNSIPKESSESKKAWKSQKTQSENEKERRRDESNGNDGFHSYKWKLCNHTTGPDYIPCLDNLKALKKLKTTKHFEHRERHCPEEGPTCLVPLPFGYKKPISWPKSRDKIWYHNVPHTKLAEFKGHQNWVKVSGELLIFPGGGTQFIHGALHYIDFLQQTVPNIKWGKRSRVVLDVGCGVASFGGFLFDRDVLTMSFAPKDEHEAQVQFALERGIPAISAVMGSQRLPFPCRVFDLVHCARCRVPWHNEKGMLLLELNRVLRPGGYFVWSATPVYQKLPEDVEIWKGNTQRQYIRLKRAMSALTKSICWELVTIKKDKLNSVAAAIYRKPTTNECYDQRPQNNPPMCDENDDANAACTPAGMHAPRADKSGRKRLTMASKLA